MRQVDQNLAHTLVQDNCITLLHEFTDNLSFIILDDQYLMISFDVEGAVKLLTSSGLTIFSIITSRRFDKISEYVFFLSGTPFMPSDDELEPPNPPRLRFINGLISLIGRLWISSYNSDTS